MYQSTKNIAHLKESRAGLGVLDLGQDADDAHNNTKDQIEGDEEFMQAAAVSLKNNHTVLKKLYKHNLIDLKNTFS